MARKRKYRQRYDYSVQVIIGERAFEAPAFAELKCDRPSQALILYDKNPQQHKIIMTPRRGGIKRTIRPRVDRQEMLTLGFDELVQRIRYQAPWAEGDDTAYEHAIENALLLNIPARMLLGIIRPHWLLTEKRDLNVELSKTHRRWLESKRYGESLERLCRKHANDKVGLQAQIAVLQSELDTLYHEMHTGVKQPRHA